MPSVYVAGVGITRFGKAEASLTDLMAEAGREALADAGARAPECIYVGAMNPEEFVGDGNIAALVADYLGFARLPSLRVETATSSGAAVFFAAFTAVVSGFYRSALVVAGEKMTHLDTPRVTEIISRVIDPYERTYGATMPALAALVARAYMEEHGVGLRDISLVAVKNHRNGALNPKAHFQRPVSLEEVMASRVIADPLRLYDCSPISDGAAAALLASEPGRAPVRVAGIAQGTDYMAVRNRDSLCAFRATREAAARAYRMADVPPEDVHVAEVHDAFTPFEIINTEDLGLFEAGKGARALARGQTALDGSLPVNPSGGLKARGHPLAASGLAQIVEIANQLRGECGQRQVARAGIGLAHSIGGLATTNWVTILRSDRG
jgi:acetyl-CoA C-acetyltransferase